MSHKTLTGLLVTLLVGSMGPTIALAAEEGRRIEEIVVTAERRESTVQDTSISISAFDADFIENFNIRDQTDLQNYIPATIIQPYDANIRGVGRTARTLGGEPGVATYFNGVYSEDFGIASTEGGLQDLARVEVLRGPQGVLYGRSAVGGAINFETKRPTDEYEIDVEALVGNFDATEVHYALSGPIIRERLKARLTGSDRSRDGYIENTSPFEGDINDYGDENYALALEFTPTDRISVFARGNDRLFRRRFNGGAGTSPLTVGEGGVTPDGNFGFVEEFRNTTDLAFGFREIDRNVTNPALAFQRNFFDPSAEVFQFTNPATGAVVEAQKIRPGIDANAEVTADGSRGDLTSEAQLPNHALGFPDDRLHVLNRDSFDGGDLKVDTNDGYEERFDHSSAQFNFTYDHDRFSFKYIFGYTDFTYERNTDEDKTGATRLGDSQFYVIQENENWQHEVQFLFDVGPVDFTSGVFVYESTINQRLDLYDPIDPQGRIQQAASLDGFGLGSDQANNQAFGGFLQILDAIPEAAGGLAVGTRVINQPLLDIRTAERMAKGGEFEGAGPAGGFTVLAPWFGGDTIANPTALRGSDAELSERMTPGTHFAWSNDTETDALAVYTQADWQITPRFSSVLGVRYSRDDKRR